VQQDNDGQKKGVRQAAGGDASPVVVGLCVPTLNAGAQWREWLAALRGQQCKPARVLVVDSSSTDDTVALALADNLSVHVIPRGQFNHGGTRQLAVDLLGDAGIVVFLTQDAILAGPKSLEKLLEAFDDPSVGAAYGRQLPRRGARPIEAHARLYNYPGESRVKSLADAGELGIKVAFISNSFAAYRRVALEAVGGFPSGTIMNEDTYAAGKMLLSGWKIAYRAEAGVYHSHDYSLLEECRRYFDIGVFHARERWMREALGSAEGEGLRYVRSERAYLAQVAPHLIPAALMRAAGKLAGYRLGLLEERLPLRVKRSISMQPSFWTTR